MDCKGSVKYNEWVDVVKGTSCTPLKPLPRSLEAGDATESLSGGPCRVTIGR